MKNFTNKKVDCNNLCNHSEQTCSYCKNNYNVSSDFYKAKRTNAGGYVTGYLVKDKKGNIQGILNKDNDFAELAFILASTLTVIKRREDYEQCEYFTQEDVMPYHNDVFDHPTYECFCTKNNGKKMLLSPVTRCAKCKDYKALESEDKE